MTISDFLNLLVAIGTIAMAVFTWMAVVATKRSMDETEAALAVAVRTAEATERSSERMKDSLRPHFDLSVQVGMTLEGRSEVRLLVLTIRNVGNGPGIIRLLSHTTDVVAIRPSDTVSVEEYGNGSELRQEQISDLSIGAHEETKLRLGHKSALYDKEEKTGSVSIFYEDLYGRSYRARLVYSFGLNNDGAVIIPLNREHFTEVRVPVITDVRQHQDIEGPSTQYLSVFQRLHLFNFVKDNIGKIIVNQDVSQTGEVEIVNINIKDDGFPEFHLRVAAYPAFILISNKANGAHRKVYVRNSDYAEPEAFQDVGLIARGSNDDQRLSDLYVTLCCEALGIDKSLFPGTYMM